MWGRNKYRSFIVKPLYVILWETKVLKKKVPNKTKVNVMYISKGYAKVEYNGVVGYMKAKYLL